MNKGLPIILGVVLSASVTRDAAAQWNVATFDVHANRVYSTVGLNPAFATSVGYGRVVSLLDHRFEFTGEVGLGAAELDLHDFRVRLGALTSIVHWRSLHLTGAAMFITRGTENSIYRGVNFGADFTGTLGAYRSSWSWPASSASTRLSSRI